MVFARNRRNAGKLEVKSVRIILFALCASVVAIGGVAIGLAGARTQPVDEAMLNMMLIVLGGLAAGQPIAFFAVRIGIMRALMNRTAGEGTANAAEDERARQAFLTLRIIAAAMAEGVGLFAAIIAITTGSMVPLAVIPPVVVIIAMQFPTESQMKRFSSECMRKLVR